VAVQVSPRPSPEQDGDSISGPKSCNGHASLNGVEVVKPVGEVLREGVIVIVLVLVRDAVVALLVTMLVVEVAAATAVEVGRVVVAMDVASCCLVVVELDVFGVVVVEDSIEEVAAMVVVDVPAIDVVVLVHDVDEVAVSLTTEDNPHFAAHSSQSTSSERPTAKMDDEERQSWSSDCADKVRPRKTMAKISTRNRQKQRSRDTRLYPRASNSVKNLERPNCRSSRRWLVRSVRCWLSRRSKACR